jgi:putative hemolysin
MESDTLWGEIVLIGLAMLLYGMLSGTEVALRSAQKRRLQQWQEEGRAGAAAAVLMRDAPERFLITLQIAMTGIGVFAAVLAGAVASQEVAPRLAAWWPLPRLAAWAQPLTLALVIGVLTYMALIVGQIVPRAIALQHPERLLCWLASPLSVLTRVCGVFRVGLTASLAVVWWILGQRHSLESGMTAPITEEEVTTIVREGAARGIFEAVEHELIQGVFEFTDTAAREIMVPRVDIQALEVTTPPPDVMRKLSDIGHSRVPVYSGNLDHIVGVLYFKDVLRVLAEEHAWDLSSLLHPPLFVPETVQISLLLRTLQQRHLNMAIVVDEHGGVAGLVTIEDLLEELVGEIRDEDEPEAGAEIVHLPDGSLVIQGSVPLRELRERLALPVEESSDYHTLAGLLLARLGCIPQGGETVVEQGYTFTVVDMDGPRIVRIKVEQRVPAETGGTLPVLPPGNRTPQEAEQEPA